MGTTWQQIVRWEEDANYNNYSWTSQLVTLEEILTQSQTESHPFKSTEGTKNPDDIQSVIGRESVINSFENPEDQGDDIFTHADLNPEDLRRKFIQFDDPDSEDKGDTEVIEIVN